MPPMYWATGIHLRTSSGSNGRSSSSGEQYRRKYQDESTNVSIVSVSRSAGPPHDGQVVSTQARFEANGDCPFGCSSSPRMSGSSTGSWSSGTGTVPQAPQWTTGIGQPQYLCRDS